METFAWVCAWLAIVPAVMTIWNLLLYRPPPRQGEQASLSVLIPARNEADKIEASVRSALSNTGVDLEVVVLDDHSTDGTADVVRAIGDPRVRVELAPPLPPGWSGKQHACWHLSKLARHPLLVFVDADVRLSPDGLGRMAAFMARNPEAGLASGFPHQETGTWPERLVIPMIHFLLLGFLPVIGMRLSDHPGFGAGCGQLFIARADAYAKAGGHAEIKQSLHDGVKLPRAFRRAGIHTELFDAEQIATCRMYRSGVEVWQGFTKNATEGMATPIGLPIWTTLLAGGHILPFLLLLGGPPEALFPACVGIAVALGTRLGVAFRFDQSIVSALLHPLGVAIMLAIQWSALWTASRGRPSTWRGRAYPTGES
ncbi:glycosyl transferase [Skermanella stibiiresistens SB22]|uniref:Glycosyl transferase n=1 Tax=Skermanella stibiiresistens SB22 TaxID=1385369 RepID=W9GVW2_9PROT|nr:glycosyltransferase family 2 protein [Skermanella stibiiresistens]EWY37949.1 glycosyl transferase [Skermanella stibiiresistens SB22]